MKGAWLAGIPPFAELLLGLGLIAVVVAAFFLKYFYDKAKKRRAKEAAEAAPIYEKRALLTDYEAACYQQLAPIARRQGLHILTKVRIADFVGVRSGLPPEEWGRCFSKIKAKHVDFILAEEGTLEPRLLLELDDSTHLSEAAQARDALVDQIYAQAGYPVLHITDLKNLEQQVAQALRQADHI